MLTIHHETAWLIRSAVYETHHTTESENHTSAYDRHMMASYQSSEYDHSVMKLRPLGLHYTTNHKSVINVRDVRDRMNFENSQTFQTITTANNFSPVWFFALTAYVTRNYYHTALDIYHPLSCKLAVNSQKVMTTTIAGSTVY